ncbi:hypothetical protein Tco_1023600, partial [Tanacetum coccineum]
ECEDEFKGRTTTLGGTLITAIGGLWRAQECCDGGGQSKIAFFTKGHQFVALWLDILHEVLYTCKVDGQGAWMRSRPCWIRQNYNYGVKFKADFVLLDYVNEGEPSILFGRDFLVTTKSQVNFGLGEIRMNLTKFKEGIEMIDLTEEVGSSSEEVVKMGKENRNKGYNINKLTPPPSLRVEEIPSTSTISPQPIYHPLTQKQKEKMKEVLDIKYKELEESKPILEVSCNIIYIYRSDIKGLEYTYQEMYRCHSGCNSPSVYAPLCLGHQGIKLRKCATKEKISRKVHIYIITMIAIYIIALTGNKICMS